MVLVFISLLTQEVGPIELWWAQSLPALRHVGAVPWEWRGQSSRLSCGWELKVLVAQSSPTLCNSVDSSPPGSSVRGIFQARVLEWVAISFSRGFPWPRDQTQVSCIAGRFCTICATREAFIPTLGPRTLQTALES